MEATIEQNNEIIKDTEPWRRKEGELLIARTMNERIENAKTEPIPRMLFGELWHEGELCILFSFTGFGKSVLATQIGNAIAKGESLLNFKTETEPQKVMYFDFELTDKQIENRYSTEFTKHHVFNDNFISVTINNTAFESSLTYENLLIKEIEKCIEESQIKIIIIDNLTDIRGDVEHAKDAIPFMHKLDQLKKKHKISILLLAHTPKKNEFTALSLNDLAGSSALAKIPDSCFAIGRSVNDTRIRYIKQLKERYTENIYGPDNVIICQLEKPENFLYFSFMKLGRENDLLKNASDTERDNNIRLAKRLSLEGNSLRKIATQVGVSYVTVSNWLKSNQTVKGVKNDLSLAGGKVADNPFKFSNN